MATIKDIAKLANTSQGTVSNVLNNKGNVSSDKIQRVLKAAKDLNYIPNQNAKNLRKGHTENFYLIIPNLESQVYRDIYSSFYNNAKKMNINIKLLISHNNYEQELKYIEQLVPEILISKKLALVTVLPYGMKNHFLTENILENIIFVLNDYIESKHFLTFNYKKAAKEIFLQFRDYNSLCVVHTNIPRSIENEACETLSNLATDTGMKFSEISVDPFKPHQSILSSINSEDFPDAYILLNYEYEKTLREILNNFNPNKNYEIISFSPLSFFKDDSLLRYEFDYHLLGRIAINSLIYDNSIGKQKLRNIGFRNWKPNLNTTKRKTLELLTVDNPSAEILKYLAKEYYILTDIPINVNVRSYNEVFQILSNEAKFKKYDIIRMDINWFSKFAKKIYLPIPDYINKLNNLQFNNTIVKNYLSDGENIYAYPFSPSSIILFYRKDLFERQGLKRMYLEEYKTELNPPTNFKEYDQISRFFTKKYNHYSPTSYGTTLTLGNSAVRASEFLIRYYSYEKSIIGDDNNIVINQDSLNKTLINLRNSLKYSNPKQNNWWTDTAKEFSNGNVAMSLVYSNYAPEFLKSNSKIKDKIGQTIVPGANPMLGGGGIGINKYSTSQEEGIDFLNWISSETIASQASLLGNLPSNITTYEYTQIIDKFPWYVTTKESIDMARCKKTHLNQNSQFDEVALFNIIGNKKIITELGNNKDIELISNIISTDLDNNIDEIINNLKNSQKD